MTDRVLVHVGLRVLRDVGPEGLSALHDPGESLGEQLEVDAQAITVHGDQAGDASRQAGQLGPRVSITCSRAVGRS